MKKESFGMKILANGEEQQLDGQNVSVADLLKTNDIESPEMVSVQLNGEFIDPGVYETTKVKEGDEVDFLYLMGGGGA